MKTIQVPAQLFPVVRGFRAELGDQVMIVAGVCVGVYSGSAGVPVVPAAMLQAPAQHLTSKVPEHPRQPKQTDVRRQPLDKPKPKHGSTLRQSTIAITRQVLVALEDSKRLTVRELHDYIGLPQSAKESWKVRDAVAWLRHNGYMTVEGNTASRVYVWSGKRGPIGLDAPHDPMTDEEAA